MPTSKPDNLHRSNLRTWREQEGMATLIAVIALSIFSLLGLIVSFNATTELRISDNHESQVQASAAAQAGLNHARTLLRGVAYNDLLRGPDGVGDTATAPSTLVEEYAFRNWVGWTTARALDIQNPGSYVGGLPDDGLMHEGGTVLIPATGVALAAPNPYGAGTVTTGRYFVKVADNPDAEDGDGDPFSDADDIIVIRSLGLSETIHENGGGINRANSVSIYEAKYQKSKAFDLEAPVILQGPQVVPAAPNMFNGNRFLIDGNNYPYGIGVIDTGVNDGWDPEAQVEGYLGNGPPNNQYDNIIGASGQEPAVGNVTPQPGSYNYDLMDPAYVYDFMFNTLRAYADSLYVGNTRFSGGGAPYLGHYDPTLPRDAPGQDYRITYVDGDLDLSGNLEGGGILAVTGSISGSGSLTWNGLILVIGDGVANFSGMNVGITGGIYVVNVYQDTNGYGFGNSQFTISGNSVIRADDEVIKLGVDSLPAKEISYREVTSEMDP